MQIFRNPARERLQNGELALGIGLRQARTVDIAPAMKAVGFDWLFIDLEHGAMELDTAVQISVAALAAGISPLVRVPKGRYDLAARALDGGAFGIVMPHVDTADEAREIVNQLKYPPVGHRSIAGAMPHFGFQSVPLADAAAAVNSNMLIVAMLETPQAIANAEAIAAVPGIDVLLIGTNDLTSEMGYSRRADARAGRRSLPDDGGGLPETRQVAGHGRRLLRGRPAARISASVPK